jgi:hypothetical protein
MALVFFLSIFSGAVFILRSIANKISLNVIRIAEESLFFQDGLIYLLRKQRIHMEM